jgi:hypothetical protein
MVAKFASVSAPKVIEFLLREYWHYSKGFLKFLSVSVGRGRVVSSLGLNPAPAGGC